ncbi:hypothetical protein ASD65_04850 [Microbacterium sp. Root61]|uniref:TetR/AcrR family transcriptional regulator n=1 Tax=Microbacterium sp. Root61 TaxID=1736570 RepID=UPI0006F3D1F3|nr:TetR family transcriptional regulator [Microbacterium sp. Root61]KRA23824.1 hypothetical protein ASD65_04850 [Microbacterium sp. Root61]
MARNNERSEATRVALMEAALQVTADVGVRGVTHRRVAQQAGVALGVTSYHYASIDELLLEAFSLWVSRMSAKWEARFLSAKTEEDVLQAAVSIISAQHGDKNDRILLYELYAQTVRDSNYHELAANWSQVTRASIERLYSPTVAQQLEAAWEGLAVQLVMGGSIEKVEQGEALLRLVLQQEQPRIREGVDLAELDLTL